LIPRTTTPENTPVPGAVEVLLPSQASNPDSPSQTVKVFEGDLGLKVGNKPVSPKEYPGLYGEVEDNDELPLKVSRIKGILSRMWGMNRSKSEADVSNTPDDELTDLQSNVVERLSALNKPVPKPTNKYKTKVGDTELQKAALRRMFKFEGELPAVSGKRKTVNPPAESPKSKTAKALETLPNRLDKKKLLKIGAVALIGLGVAGTALAITAGVKHSKSK